MTDLIEVPARRAIVLRNTTCAYCGRPFGQNLKITKEHVIGRRFVPRGFLSGQWNLILNACKNCNGDKSDLEDEISAISMSLDPMGSSADDPRLMAEITRKARSRSRRTGKTVADSSENIELKGAFGPVTFGFKFTAPPQIDDMRLYRLAHYHFRGFFYFITYQRDTNRGGFVLGSFFPLGVVQHADWGSPRQRWFMDTVRNWDVRVRAIGAEAYFKLLIRCHPEGPAIWSWAIEWNQSIRVVGFAGDENAIDILVSGAPDEPRRLIQESGNERILFRTEVPLLEQEDDLFTILVERANGRVSGVEGV